VLFRSRLLDKLKEAEILYVEQANAIAIDMCTCVRFKATIILGDGVPLLRKAESTVDEVLDAGDCEVVIVCSVNPAHIVETREDQIRAVAVMEQKKQEAAAEAAARLAAAEAEDPKRASLLRAASILLTDEMGLDNSLGDDLHSPTLGGKEDRKGKPSLKQELERMHNLTLFEMRMDQFEELLAELKVTYSYVASLSQGVSDETDDGNQSNNTVQAIFDTVDCDGSGTIDRAELAAAFKLFDETAIDPDFCEHMMDDLLPESQSALDFDSFSSFLVKFLQHQYYHKLEPFVSNQKLFVTLGGRDLADIITAERKKEQELELRNAELAHEVADLKKKLKNSKPRGKDDASSEEPDVEAAEAELESEGLDADGEKGVLKFMTKCGLPKFGPVLVAMGVDNISDLLDPDLVGDDELGEAGLSEDQVEIFREAVAKRKELGATLESAAARGIGLKGTTHEDFDPTVFGLEALTEVPVIIMNARSKRKLFAQSGKRPTIFETWNKGFGAGPEEHTFKDNKWWLVPQKDTGNYVIVNAHSSRKLFAKGLRHGAVWEKDIGAVSADDTGSENNWTILPDPDGTYTLQNAMSKRKMYARVSKAGDAWTVGVGAAPADASSADTKWYLIPDPAAVAITPAPNAKADSAKLGATNAAAKAKSAKRK
jgi:hypothetical protein